MKLINGVDCRGMCLPNCPLFFQTRFSQGLEDYLLVAFSSGIVVSYSFSIFLCKIHTKGENTLYSLVLLTFFDNFHTLREQILPSPVPMVFACLLNINFWCCVSMVVP